MAKNMPMIMIRYLAGKEIANTLGVKNSFGCMRWVIPTMFRKSIGWVEKIEDLGEPIDGLFDSISMLTMQKFIQIFDTYKGNKFKIPAEMQKAWKLN